MKNKSNTSVLLLLLLLFVFIYPVVACACSIPVCVYPEFTIDITSPKSYLLYLDRTIAFECFFNSRRDGQ